MAKCQDITLQQSLANACLSFCVANYHGLNCKSPRTDRSRLYAPTVNCRKGLQRGSGGTIRKSLDAASSNPGSQPGSNPVITHGRITSAISRVREVGTHARMPNNVALARQVRPSQELPAMVATMAAEPVGCSLIYHGHTTPRPTNNGGGKSQDHSTSPEHPTVRHFNASPVIPARATSFPRTREPRKNKPRRHSRHHPSFPQEPRHSRGRGNPEKNKARRLLRQSRHVRSPQPCQNDVCCHKPAGVSP